MSRAATKAELERWQPPRHDFWLAIAVRKRKHRPSPTGFMWRAEVDLAKDWLCCSSGRWHERLAAQECARNVTRESDFPVFVAGCVPVEEGLWFAFYRFERPAGL